MKTIIQTSHLTKYYGKARGIIDLNLSVRQGEFFGFIGPNGAGKSTTIRILLGLIHPTEGTASIFGRNVVYKSNEILRNTGYISSEAMFYTGTTVFEILRFCADLRHKDCSDEARVLCERLHLNPALKTEALSLGNRKKLAIVCALQHRPDLYIFDEPTSGLDPLIQKEFFEIMAERQDQGATVFFSSHILSEVQKHCSRAAVIREGQIAACGDISELAKTGAKRIVLSGTDTKTLEHILRSINKDPSGALHLSVRDYQAAGESASFLCQGNIKDMLALLSPVPFTDIAIAEPDLNEVFMHYYETGSSSAPNTEAKGGDQV